MARSRALLDAGGAVADDPIEALAQFVHHPLHPVFGQRVLVARLRGRKQVEGLETLVPDQRLRKLGVALHHIDQIEDDASLRPHDQVEVAQAHVEIDEDDLLPAWASAAPREAEEVVLPTPPCPT